MTEKKKIQKIEDSIVYLPGVRSVGVIGDPGCDGLGTYNMKVYAGTLEKSGRDDITLVVGDLVPEGSETYYKMFTSLTEEVAHNDVYVLRGNHDTGTYRDYFGRQNYALILEDFSIVVLDNALRTFEKEGLELLRQVLDMEEIKNIVIAFHIPVPNHFISNSVSEEEFTHLKEAYKEHKEKVKYLLCGHVHSRFVDEVDEIPLICTGGGGALIEDVSLEVKAYDVEHHMVHFYKEDGELTYRFHDLDANCYGKEASDKVLKNKLEEAIEGELMAHFKYAMFADRAKRRGMEKIASLFEALAASEYYHARNFYSILERPLAFRQEAGTFIYEEKFEYEYLYEMMEKYAKEKKMPLSAQAFKSAAGAEKVHAALLKEVQQVETFSIDTIYVCPICGYVMWGDKVPKRCPICGGASQQYEMYE